MPAGQQPLTVAIILNLLTYVLAVISALSIPNGLMLAISDIAITGLCLYVAVSLMQKNARFQQAFTALTGGTAVLNSVAIPLLWLSVNSDSAALQVLNYALIFWGLAIIAHVLRYTLEISLLFSVGLALTFYVVVLNLLAVMGVIGDPASAEQQLSIYQALSAHWLSKA